EHAGDQQDDAERGTGQQRDERRITFHVGSYAPRVPAGSILRGSMSVFLWHRAPLGAPRPDGDFPARPAGTSERSGSWLPLYRVLGAVPIYRERIAAADTPD